MSFIEISDILLQNVHACYVGDCEEYLSSTRATNYGKILADYWAMLTSLPDDVSDYLSVHFSQSSTSLPYSCQPIDLWIEVTMNLDSKLKQGWLTLFQNDLQLFVRLGM